MEIKIRNVDFVYGTDQVITNANVRFDTNDTGFGINGYVQLTIDEYNTNASDISALSAIVTTKLKDKVATL